MNSANLLPPSMLQELLPFSWRRHVPRHCSTTMLLLMSMCHQLVRRIKAAWGWLGCWLLKIFLVWLNLLHSSFFFFFPLSRELLGCRAAPAEPTYWVAKPAYGAAAPQVCFSKHRAPHQTPDHWKLTRIKADGYVTFFFRFCISKKTRPMLRRPSNLQLSDLCRLENKQTKNTQ